MKRKSYAALAITIVLQLLLSGFVTVSAADDSAVGEAYTAPESPAVTYNMNLDWKFYDTKTVGTDVWTAAAKADKDGKKFWEKDYDDSAWETVSIPHGIGGGTNSFTGTVADAGGGYRSVLLYRKTFTLPGYEAGGKVFFELEGIRQAAYLWVNGEKVGYYEAGITAMGFDISNYVAPGEEAVIAIINDGTTTRGTTSRYIRESVPGQTLAESYQIGIDFAQQQLDRVNAKGELGYTGSDRTDIKNKKAAYESRLAALTDEEKSETWGTSFGDLNDKTKVGTGSSYVWNTKDFNEPEIGLVYDAYLHIKGKVYQTLPLYNNLKTTGNYIYADNFDVRGKSATIHVDAEVRNESESDGSYTLEVAVVDMDGNLKYDFESEAAAVAKASDAGVVYEKAVEADVYTDAKLPVTTELDGVADPSLLEQINDSSKRPAYTSDADKNGHRKYYTYNETWSSWTAIPDGFEQTQYDERGYRYEYRDKDSKSVAYTSSAAKEYRLLLKVDQIRHNESFATEIITPDVTHITASYNASDMRFWSIEDPYLYTVYTILKDSSGAVVDVQKKDTGFRKITFDSSQGILINDKAVWMPGYAQRSTNEWAVIGSATDWLQDYDMSLLKENNANFIRWMHVAPKPFEVRSSDRYGVAVVVPAGDKEGTGLTGREWAQRAEAMRDAMIYFRNSPSVVFWETGNSAVGYEANANEMADLRDRLDAHGMRFIGARSTTASSQLNYDYNYAGTMYGNYASSATNAMKSNGKPGPIMETEYARDEAPRRVWDKYSPPDFDYVNKYISKGGKKDGYDVWNLSQEEASINNIREYDIYYSNRNGYGSSYYSAAAMMVWSDSNMHTRNTATENCRTTGRVDPVRQTKEMFEVTKTAQSSTPDIHIVGHWSYPELSEDTYNYYGTNPVKIDDTHNYEAYDTTQKYKRDPLNKTVYVIGSSGIEKVELYRIDGEEETLLGTDEEADSTFIYQFDNIDVTRGDGVIAKAYDARNKVIATDEIARTYDAVSIRLTPHTAVKEDADGNTVSDWRADGSDIAYIDVEVIDKNGNVCALNYDKISFSYSGDGGVYLGGYNSGSGSGAFQNNSASAGLSFYFGGAKDGVSTIGKDYVYAENGTNRIFVKSTRTAGDFTLTASMNGMMPVSTTITSEPVETEGGLTTVMPSILKPGASAAPINSNVLRMKPLMLNKLTIDWANVKTVTEQDKNVYYDVYLNGAELTLAGRTHLGPMDNLFGPIYEILQAAQNAGADGFSMTYGMTSEDLAELVVTAGGHTYQYLENRNQVLIDGTEYTECVDTTVITDGIMIANLGMMLEYAGVGYSIDHANKTISITTN